MSTPTPSDLDRQAGEWAKSKCMEMGVEYPITPIVITTKHTSSGSRTVISGLDVLMTRMQQLERERDSLRHDLEMMTACWKAEKVMRDTWKAKAERTCRWDCKLSPTTGVAGHSTECGSQYIYDPGAVWCKLCGGRIVRHL